MVRKGKDSWLHLQQIVHYVKTKEFLDSVTPDERDVIRKRARNFVVEGNNVYYCGWRRDHVDLPVEKRLVITSEEEVKAVLQEAHDKGGHQGTKRTQDKIISQYYWLSITQDVIEWVRSCTMCQCYKKRQTQGSEVHPIKKPHLPEDFIVIKGEPYISTPVEEQESNKRNPNSSRSLPSSQKKQRQSTASSHSYTELGPSQTSCKKRKKAQEQLTTNHPDSSKETSALQRSTADKSLKEDMPHLLGALVREAFNDIPKDMHLRYAAKLIEYLSQLKKEALASVE